MRQHLYRTTPSLLLSLGLLSLGCESSRAKPQSRMTTSNSVVVGDSDSPSPSDKVDTESGEDTGSAEFDTGFELSPTAKQIQRINGMVAWDFGHANGAPTGVVAELIAKVGNQLAKQDIVLEATPLDSASRMALIEEYLMLVTANGEPPEAILILLLTIAQMNAGIPDAAGSGFDIERLGSSFSTEEQRLFELYHAAIAPEKSIADIVDLAIAEMLQMQMRSKQSEGPIYLNSLYRAQQVYHESMGTYLSIPPCPDALTPTVPRAIPQGACPELETLLGEPSWMGEIYGSYSFEITETGVKGTVRMDIDGDQIPAVFTINEAGEVKQITPEDVF